MNLRNLFQKYLGSRRVWAAALAWYILSNALVYVMNGFFSPEIVTLASSILYVFLMALPVYYLSDFDLEGKRDDLVIASTFAAVALLSAIVSMIGYLVFTPLMAPIGFAYFLTAPVAFLMSTGLYHLITDLRFEEARKSAYSVLMAVVTVFAFFMVIEDLNSGSAVLQYFSMMEVWVGMFEAFIMLYAVTSGLENYSSFEKDVLAVIVLGALGSLHLGVNWLEIYVLQFFNPVFPVENLQYISYDWVVAAFAGLSYFVIENGPEL